MSQGARRAHYASGLERFKYFCYLHRAFPSPKVPRAPLFSAHERDQVWQIIHRCIDIFLRIATSESINLNSILDVQFACRDTAEHLTAQPGPAVPRSMPLRSKPLQLPLAWQFAGVSCLFCFQPYRIISHPLMGPLKGRMEHTRNAA